MSKAFSHLVSFLMTSLMIFPAVPSVETSTVSAMFFANSLEFSIAEQVTI